MLFGALQALCPASLATICHSPPLATPSFPALQLSAAAEYEPGKLSGAAALDAAFDGPAAEARVEAASLAAAAVGKAAAAAGGGAGGTHLQRAQNFLDEAALYSGAQGSVCSGRPAQGSTLACRG